MTSTIRLRAWAAILDEVAVFTSTLSDGPCCICQAIDKLVLELLERGTDGKWTAHFVCFSCEGKWTNEIQE